VSARATAAGPSSLVAAQGLTQEYPGFRALKDVTFTIAAGTVTALVGPNGAGKTTLMRCLAALDSPFAGRVWVDGLDAVERPRLVHRRTGFLQDFFGLYDALTVAQGLWYAAAARQVPAAEIESRIDWAANAVGLGDRLDRRAGTLSRGMRQRLAVAQTIVHRPRVVLLDEPASGLDPESRAELAALLRSLRETYGMTLLVSSHILAELEDYSTHVMILNDGRLVRHDSIGAGAGTDTAGMSERTMVEVTLAHDMDDLPTRLEAIGVSARTRVDHRDGKRRLSIDMPSDDDPARATLLRDLIGAGLPVSGFTEQRRSLQDVYLDQMRRTNPPTAPGSGAAQSGDSRQ